MMKYTLKSLLVMLSLSIYGCGLPYAFLLVEDEKMVKTHTFTYEDESYIIEEVFTPKSLNDILINNNFTKIIIISGLNEEIECDSLRMDEINITAYEKQGKKRAFNISEVKKILLSKLSPLDYRLDGMAQLAFSFSLLGVCMDLPFKEGEKFKLHNAYYFTAAGIAISSLYLFNRINVEIITYPYADLKY